jgi:hypothetical protein
VVVEVRVASGMLQAVVSARSARAERCPVRIMSQGIFNCLSLLLYANPLNA